MGESVAKNEIDTDGVYWGLRGIACRDFNKKVLECNAMNISPSALGLLSFRFVLQVESFGFKV